MINKRFLIIFLMICSCFQVFCEENVDLSNDFNNEKLTYTIQRRFSNKSTLDITDFYFYLGEKELSLNEVKNLTKDPLFAKTDKMLKTITINGSVVGSVFGLTLVASVIPAGILINNAVAETMVADKYLFSGIAMFAIAACSVVGIVVDIIVATTMYHKYRYNEDIIRNIVDRYNKKLKSVSFLPDLSFKNDDAVQLMLRIKL